MEKTKVNRQRAARTTIKSLKELEREVEITMHEIEAEKTAEATGGVSKAEIKAAVDILNPDVASTKGRG